MSRHSRGSVGAAGGRGWRPALRLGLALVAVAAALALVGSSRLAQSRGWRAISPGIEYRRLRIPASDATDIAELHALRVDPGRCRLRVVCAGTGRTAPVRELAARYGALAVINGGFFDPQFRPLGLRVSHGEQLRPLRRADWGVFLVRAGRPAIVHTRDYHPAGVTEAVQCGPRLVVDGHATRLKKQSARRACIGIDGRGRVLLVVSQGADVDATNLARALSAPDTGAGLGCHDALNMDGGPSAQLFAAHRGFRLDLPGTWGVPDGLGVFAR